MKRVMLQDGEGVEEELALQCRLCHKTMQNRIRGFHILWHMGKDLGINRYSCQLCPFSHDRSQSVQTHGKREHGREDVVQDKIDEFKDEVMQMSKACFGFQALFSADSRRRSKIPLAPKKPSPEDSAAEEVSEEGEVEEEEDDRKRNLNSCIKRLSNGAANRKPQPREKRVEMAKLREVSLLIGGAQYFKKRLNEAAHCNKCGVFTTSRMSDHVYKHLNAHLFCCPHCELGHYSREIVVRHIRDMHRTQDVPLDKRLQFAQEIKDMVRECYPEYFKDAPLPSAADIEKLKMHIGAEEFARIIAKEEEDQEEEEDEQPATLVKTKSEFDVDAYQGIMSGMEEESAEPEDEDEEEEEMEEEI